MLSLNGKSFSLLSNSAHHIDFFTYPWDVFQVHLGNTPLKASWKGKRFQEELKGD